MQFSWWTFLLQGVNFLVLVWLLHRFLYRPVQQVIAKRKEITTSALAKADDAEQAARRTKQRYDTALAEIDTERAHALEKARQEIEAERGKVLKAAHEQAATIVEDAKGAIGLEREAAKASLKHDTADLAVELAGKMLTEISPFIPETATLDYVVEEITRLPEGEKKRLASELRANGSRIEIITAPELDEAAREEWASRLERVLGHGIEPRFSFDKDLIAGAVLKLPHTAIRVTWADQLSAARQTLLEGEHG